MTDRRRVQSLTGVATLTVTALLVTSASILWSQVAVDVQGPYLGQEPPGSEPQLFAP